MLLSSLTPAAIQQAGHHFGPGFGAGFAFLIVLVPLFWVAVVAIIVRLATRRWHRFGGRQGLGGHGWGAPWAASAAETTLAERFAQGDIDEQEYRARLEVLRANRYFPQGTPGSKKA